LLKIKINSNEKAKSSINLKSVISSIDRRTNPLPTTGLLKLPDVKNAATWDITSSPNSTYRSLFDFFYDAFCILSFDNNNWTISLYNQDTRNATGFNKTDFELYKKSIPNSESNSTQLVSSKNKPTKDIYVGAILGISGWIQELDTKTLEGLNLRFNKCNELNELKNKKIQLVYADHQYDPALALMQMQKLYAQYKVDMFIRFVGTDMVKACLNFMNNNNIYSLFPSISFSFAKIEDQKNIIYLKNHFEDEASALVNYSIKNLLCKKFALFYQNDEFGKGMLNAAVSVLEKKGIPQNKYLVLPQPRSSADATKAAELITKFEPECVFCFIVPVPVINLISKITTSSVKYYLGTSSTEHRNLREFIRDKGVKYIFSHVFPNTNDPSITIVKEYLTELKKINQQPEGYSFAAYVSADLLVETIKQIAEPVTTEKIINKLRAIKNYNFKGINLNYNAKNLCLSNDIWIETEDGTWLYLPTNSEGTPK
jgi:ABC-type branched-subunit amino acid transport system substrate-binding protein